ncbi:hypothetical protein P8Q88_03360 [Qipengyuania sp. XHP0207]|uniref:hypothetical protein n=1 Tax=Qipengyuania sp. XHP0207 TaxID=3038078 RepID=UPI00241D3E8E|nr:hypothetical protein [Qipengyuania sp. XHP0207]MDG5747209.1 hypothetical protein [Qipengyuania sp. XHP0207]
MTKVAICALALVALSGCDMATEMAGDAIKSEVRTQYIERCQGVAESAGIAAERISAACECSADTFAEDFAADGSLDIDRARIEDVLRMCVEDNGAAAPAEG